MIKDLFLFYGEKHHCFVAYFYLYFNRLNIEVLFLVLQLDIYQYLVRFRV